MKRTLTITVFFIVFILIYFLQTNLFCWYNIAGIKPNLFIIYIIATGIYMGKKYGFILGTILGIFLDLFIGKRIGFNGVILGFLGVIGGILEEKVPHESRISFMIIVFFTTILAEIIGYGLQILILKTQIYLIKFIRIVIIEAIFNVILSIIFYPLIQKMGKLTRKFFYNEEQLFTRIY